jgi:hypothetical protein
VGAVTEVNVFDTGGTMKTDDNSDVSSKTDDVQENLTNCNRVRNYNLTSHTDNDVRKMQEYCDDHDANDDVPDQVRETPHDPGGNGAQGKIKDQESNIQVQVRGALELDMYERLTMVEFMKDVHRSQAEEMASMIDNFDNSIDVLYMLEDAQEASRERQKILGSMMLQEEDDSKLAKKFADKSAANLLGSMNIKMTSRIKTVVKCELIDKPCDEIQDKGGEGEIPVPVSGEDYNEVAAEVVQRP